jgi:hypothetical protein
MKRLIFFLLFIIWFSSLLAQQEQLRYTLSGYIKDAGNGEDLIGATIYEPNLATGTVSNVYGFFSISLPAGEYEFRITSVGYRTKTEKVFLKGNTTLNIRMDQDVLSMQEIVITDRAIDENVTDVSMSRMKMDIQQVKKLPPLFGEPDIIKSIQLMPGVLIAGEGSSSYFVRGGNSDHNLILLDEAPVYDPSHLFGLVSVFNSSSLKNSELLKGGIPSMYGGRLASILDVRTKDGNNQQFAGELGLGMLTSRVLLEGPISRNKSSFIVSGRRSYFDLFLPDDAIIKPYFYDVNAKVNFDLNQNNKVFLAFYSGRDKMMLLDDLFSWDWGNNTMTLRWNRIINKRLFLNSSLIYSNFNYKNVQDMPGFGVDWSANLREFSIKEHLEYYHNPNHSFYFGLNSSYRTFSPGLFVPTDSSSIFARTEMPKQYALDNALYAGIKQNLTNSLTMEYGLRLSAFTQLGEADVFIYEEVEDPSQKVHAGHIDTLSFGRWEPIKTYMRLEPRFSARLTIDQNRSLKMSYNRMAQYVHQMATGSSPMPIAIWQPSGYHIKPQIADQVAIGYFRNMRNHSYEGSVEVYYKNMKDIIDFRDNANVFFNQDLPLELAPGTSFAYGSEFLLRKVTGKMTGWASYTWSKVLRDVPGVNQDQLYHPTYDRRHNGTVVATYDLSKRISLGGTWIYGTGRSQTLPQGTYYFGGQVVDYYTGRNEFKLNDFHRLDLSLNFYSKEKPGRRWKSEFNLSLYNVYGRRNPYMVYTNAIGASEDHKDDYDAGGGLKDAKEIRQVNLFGILPSFSYLIKF